jgi:hypothetical protein
LSADQGLVIAKRSVSLSKAYTVVGVFLAVLSVLISSLPRLVGSLTATSVPLNSTGTTGAAVLGSFSLISVPLQVFAAIAFTTPILLLYVYDKNNGVLEYFLSLGMDQGDVYRNYLKAALILSSSLIAFEVVLNIVVGVIERSSLFTLLGIPGLVVAISIPVVSFTTLAMIAFSSLQKQRVGSNQPLGIAIGIFMVMPAYIAPLVAPSLVVNLDLLLAAIVVVLSLLMYFLSSRLISREKLLP